VLVPERCMMPRSGIFHTPECSEVNATRLIPG
jgi:hypothetical protein